MHHFELFATSNTYVNPIVYNGSFVQTLKGE